MTTERIAKNYRMPAEWEPQEAIWLTWPDNRQTWPHNLAEAQVEFCALAHCLAEMVTVRILVNSRSLEDAHRQLIRPDTKNIGFINIPTNDAWVRDYGPTFVIRAGRTLAAIDWGYNAWGQKYPPFHDDQQVASKIAQGLSIDLVQPGLCFEGGAIESNGLDVVLSTRSCSTDINRNGGRDSERLIAEFEQAFNEYLGASRTVWLPGNALVGDDTDGHIDQLARFTNPHTIVYAWCQADDSQRQHLAANLSALQESLAQCDDDFELFPLPIPAQPIEMFGQRLPASYCNFLITNDLVVVPQFGCPEDQQAMQRLAALLPDHYVIGLPSRHLSTGLGSFHCLSQQQPAVLSTSTPESS